MANIEQTQQVIPLMTCEISFGQDVCKLVLGVEVSYLDLGVQINSIKQPIKSNSVGPGNMSHCSVVLETIRTGAMRVVHITVNLEETQILRIKFVLVLSYLNSNTTCTVLNSNTTSVQQFALYCPTCAYQHKQVYLSNCQSSQRSWPQILLTSQ